jgi:predicted RNase H-like HicB family nuclease
MRYIALVDGKAGAYGVVVPDLPGCTSAGSTTDAALRNAVEAVRLWAEDAVDDGEALPTPRSVEALRADPEIAAALAEGSALAIVPLLLDAGRAVRANLSLDAGLLDAIDEAARAHGLTRSAFLASAAREKIEGHAGSREMPVDTPSARTPRRGRHTNKRRA